MTNPIAKRITAIILICMLLTAFCGQALAGTAYVMKSADVYSMDRQKIGTLNPGATVNIVAEKAGWALVEKAGQSAVMKASALAAIEDCSDFTAYTRSAAPIYNNGKKIGTIPAGHGLTVSAKVGSFAYAIYNGYEGLVQASLLTTTAPSEQAAPQVAQPDYPTVYANKDATVYNIKGKAIGIIPVNTEMLLTGVNGNVCRVVKDNKTAYMNKADLSESKVTVIVPTVIPTPVPTAAPTAAPEQQTAITVYANKDAVVYNINGKAVNTVAVNTEMTLTGVNGSVCRVVKDGITAYMKKSDLSTTKVTVQETATQIAAYANKDAKVYNIRGMVIGIVPVNTAVTVTGINGSICRIVKDGATAYMNKADLSSTQVETNNSGVVDIPNTTGYVKTEGAKVYDASGAVLAALPVNTAVTVSAYNDALVQVVNGSLMGYMNKADISATPVETSNGVVDIPNTTGYVKTEGAKVYDASGAVLATLPINTAVTVSAYNDALVQVVNGSLVGYMSKNDISTTQVSVNNTSYSLKYGDSGEAVKKLQTRLRELGYFSGTIGGNYLGLTQSAVAAFQSAAKLSATGVADYATLQALFADNAPKYTAPSSGSSSANPTGASTVTPAKGTAVQADWWKSNIQKLFPRGSTVTVTDVATGLAWREYRGGGTNHADVQPATAADTAVLKRVYGGKWSWNRRAIFVTINGVNYAASMNGMPHGGGSISNNNFDGHHCIHFTNSRTHGSNKVCSLHQNAIKKALNATL